MPVLQLLTVFTITAGSFFMLGAYYQHLNVLKNLQKLERNNVHAYVIRRKLYDLLSIFCTDPQVQLTENDAEKHELDNIMRFGFPSINDIRLNHNYVTSYDRRNAAIQWMCEHIENDMINATDSEYSNHLKVLNSENYQVTATTMHVNNSEANRVFFTLNIKPFLSKGFNISVWTKLLIYIQETVMRYGSVFIYTGPIYLPKENEKNNWYLEYQPENLTMAAVPTHFFKIIVVDPQNINCTPHAEAFVIPNAPICDNTDLRALLSDVRDIEHATGLIFFDGLERNFIKTGVSTLDSEDYFVYPRIY